MRYPPAEEFVRREAASSPLSELLEDVELEMREDLIDDSVQIVDSVFWQTAWPED